MCGQGKTSGFGSPSCKGLKLVPGSRLFLKSKKVEHSHQYFILIQIITQLVSGYEKCVQSSSLN